jgi:hypothetical protein
VSSVVRRVREALEHLQELPIEELADHFTESFGASWPPHLEEVHELLVRRWPRGYRGDGTNLRVALRLPLGGSVRAAGGQVLLGSSVGRNVTLAGGEVRLAGDADVGGNAYLAGGSIRVTGPVRGSVLAGGGEVRIDGPVGEIRVPVRTTGLLER